MKSAEAHFLTSDERSQVEELLRDLNQRAALYSKAELFVGAVVGMFIGLAVYFVCAQFLGMPRNRWLFYGLLIVGSIAEATRCYRLRIRENRDSLGWEKLFLTELLSGASMLRLRVHAKRLATVSTSPDHPRPARDWMFAELEDGRVFSIGSAGPICLDQPVIPCREFEMVLLPNRQTYAFFHALSPPVQPDLDVSVEYWDAGAIPSGSEVEGGWDALPETIRRESERCAAEREQEILNELGGESGRVW